MADLDEEEIEDVLDGKNIKADRLSTYRVGPYLIIPNMSDYSESSVRFLAAAGFILEKELEVLVGNCTCLTHVFIEDPSYTGERAVLIACQDHALNWNVLLS